MAELKTSQCSTLSPQITIRFEPVVYPSFTMISDITQRLITTTALLFNPRCEEQAIQYAKELRVRYIPRDRNKLPQLFDDYGVERILVVEDKENALIHKDGSVYRYHPNMGFVRALNIVRGQRELFIEAAQLKRCEKVLDCTVGFASEAMLASIVVGEAGKVVGLESVPELALITREGLQRRILSQAVLLQAMRRIQIINSGYQEYIAHLQPESFDLIYFDPFFEERIEGSEATVNALHLFGDQQALSIDAVVSAISIATRRVLVKHPADVELPDELVALRSTIVGARRRKIRYSVFDSTINRNYSTPTNLQIPRL